MTGLRIGLMEQFGDVPVQPEIRGTVRKAARVLEQIGFKIEPFKPHGMQRVPELWWFFFGQLPAPITRQLIEGREQDAHWTGYRVSEKGA